MDWLSASLPPLNSLRVFLTAARLQGFSKAADQLGLTQAAVSRSIRTLEDDLGTQLFERRNRSVYLTQQGQTFYDSVAPALEGVASAAQAIRQPLENREITFFSQLCEGNYWVMPRLAEFHRNHPDIRVHVSASTEPVSVSNKPYDLVLQISGRAHGTYRPVFSVPDSTYPVCSPAYLDQLPFSLSLENLDACSLLHHTVDPQDWISWDHWFENLGSTYRPGLKGYTFDSYPMMVEAAIAGQGIMLGWHRTCEHLLRSGALVKPITEYVQLENGLTVYHHPKGNLRPQVHVFLKWLQAEFESQDTQQIP